MKSVSERPYFSGSKVLAGNLFLTLVFISSIAESPKPANE